MKILKDFRVPMRDGVHLAADAYHATRSNPAPRWSRSALWQGAAGAGPYDAAEAAPLAPVGRLHRGGRHPRVVAGGYVHVIGDVRGSGGSEG